MADYKFDTLSLHAGQSPDARFGSRAVPIHQTTSYVFDSTEHAAALFNMEVGGHIYSRLTNPTVAVLEQRLAALDGGVAAIATASGMSALFVTVLALCSAGDHIVSSSQMYGANINLFEHTLKRYGIETSFVPPNDPTAIAEAIRPNTKMVFGEVIGNPGMDNHGRAGCGQNHPSRGDSLSHRRHVQHPLDGQTDRIGRKCGDPFTHQMDGWPWHCFGWCRD